MRRILTTAFAVLAAAPLAFPQHALACSCIFYEDENTRYETYFNNADLVLQGIPIELEEEGKKYYNISVEKVWKGQTDAYVTIATEENSAMCGIDLELDARVIIFANKIDGKYQTGLCSGSVEANDAGTLPKWLNGDGQTTTEQEPVVMDCSPYMCANGDTFPACTEDGHAINYLVAPCQFSGGDATGQPEPEESDDFADVPEEHPHYKAISFVRSEGIVQGYADGTYGPTLFINRAEFTKIIVSATFDAEIIDECESTDLFSDVSQSDWFADYVCIAKERGIIGGYPDGTFKPAGNVNFAEAAKIVVRSFDIDTSPEDHLGVWWKPYVFALARIGGLPTSFSDPNQQLTRGDMAEIIFRVMIGIGK